MGGPDYEDFTISAPPQKRYLCRPVMWIRISFPGFWLFFLLPGSRPGFASLIRIRIHITDVDQLGLIVHRSGRINDSTVKERNKVY